MVSVNNSALILVHVYTVYITRDSIINNLNTKFTIELTNNQQPGTTPIRSCVV